MRPCYYRTREQNERARKAFLKKIEEGKEYDISWWKACRDTEWLKASGARRSYVDYDWQDKRRRLNNDGEGIDQYLELFPSEGRICTEKEFFRSSTSSFNSTGEAEGSIDWPAQAHA